MKTSRSSSRLSILHILTYLRPTNGQYNEHCLPLIHKRDITICTYFRPEITPPPGITLFGGDDSLSGFFRALRTALEDREYDIIHVHTPHAGILLLAALAGFGWWSRFILSSVHTVQNSYQSFRIRHKLMFLPSFIFFRRLVFCGHASYESFPLVFKWLAGNRVDIVQNAVDINRIDNITKSERANCNDEFNIVTVGLIEIKNPFTVLEAFRQSGDQPGELMFLGKGDLKPSIAVKAKNMGLEKQVRLTGMIPRDNVFEYYTSADLFISASFGEGLPVAVIEAMACRCPVILSDIPPHREIADGVDFIPLIDPHNIEGFTKAISRFRQMPDSDRVAIGQKCRELVEKRFGLQKMHARYAEVYSKLTGSQVHSLLEEIA